MASLKRYRTGEGPKQIIALVERLTPLLLEGDHPTLVILREQFKSARVGAIELSGVGFFAEIDVAPHAPTVAPLTFAGGDALIDLAGSSRGAGCLLFVKNGRLSLLEGYTHAGDEWSESSAVLGVRYVIPIQPT